MLYYIIQTIAFQLVFLLVYDIFLKRETFFNWNRLYLLLTPVLSLIIPLIKINEFSKVVPQDYIIRLPEVFIGDVSAPKISANNLKPVVAQTQSFSLLEIAFYAGMIVIALVFIYKVISLYRLIHKNPRFRDNNLVIVQLLKSAAAFSFFNYIFLGEHIKSSEKEAILKHEKVHVREKHSFDLLFFEMLKIVFWFNPLVYMYQNRIQTLHEFIADAEALKFQGKKQYYQNLLSQVFETKNVSFINPFFKKSLLKKRIAMLQKTKSKRIHLIKYALLIPMVLGMLIYTSCNNEIEREGITKTELSDEELMFKLKQEYDEIKNSDKNLYQRHLKFIMKSDDYILSKEAFYRQNIFFEELSKQYVKKNSGKEIYKPKTYSEYLEWKKTDEAKEQWENNTYDGVLKLVVDDMNNLTPKEKEKREKKMKLLFNDDHYTKLIQTDGKTTITLGETESKKQNNREESKFSNTVDVPFGVIEQVPTFPECGSGTNEERKKCTSETIAKFVNRNFNTKLANEYNLTGRQRINVIFKINPEGDITDVRARAPHPALEEEAKRVIKSLPKMIPGEHQGEKVNVPYSLPIIFQVAD